MILSPVSTVSILHWSVPLPVNIGTICINFYLLTLVTSCANELLTLKTEHRGEGRHCC